MPTKNLTSIICVMLTAAMLWSSLGVGLMPSPEDVNSVTTLQDVTDAGESAKPAVTDPENGISDSDKVEPSGGDEDIASCGGWNSEPTSTPWGNWSFRDAQNVPGAEAMGYTGDGVCMAVADTGIDFGAQNLDGKYMVDSTTYSVENATVAEGTVQGQNNVSLPDTNIVSGTLEIKVNGAVSTGYTANLVRGEVTFPSALPLDSTVVCSYQYRPYYGWPVAFDALGLPQYLLAKEARTGGGGVANTTLNGTGPFDIDHVIRVDGQNDYTVTESACPDDRYGDVLTPGTSTGLEFDMTELWGTRDKDFWYAGIQTRYAAMNRTFGFAMDFDGPASGSLNDPAGNLLDFEASHSAPIEQVAYDDNNDLLATCAGTSQGTALTGSYEYNSVKIWSEGGNLIRTLPNEQTPVDSVAWSPDGSRLAFTTGLETVVYNAATWTEQWRVQHSSATKTKYYREALTFSPNGTTLITGSVAASNRIFVLNVVTGSTAEQSANTFSGTVAFNPTYDLIALGLDDGTVQIIDSITYSTVMVLQTWLNKAFLIPDGKPVETVAWSPDGMHLATGRLGGGYINIWNLTGNMTWADCDFNLTGHDASQTVNSIVWPSANNIISGCDDGTVIYWNPFTSALPVTTRNSRYNTPVRSLALTSGNDVFVGSADCTVRKYTSGWSTYTAFVSHRADIMVYIRYEREYYTFGPEGQKLSEFDYIEEPDVYKWNTGTMSWAKTNMTNIFGHAFYKGSSAGEWTAKGFIEIALPRNFTAWPNQNNMYLSSFVCGDNSSRPQDTVPADCNVPSPTGGVMVNWAGTDKVTLSAWGRLDIPKTTIVPADVPSAGGVYHFGYHPSTALTKIFGLVPIVVTASSPGVWDRVYVDMNADYIIDSNDPYVNRNNPVLTVDIWDASGGTAIPGQDGIPDLSGGMLYFIGDGKTKMPYSDRMSEVLMASGDQLTPFNVDNPMPIPKNGEIVAFFGDFNYDEDEGKMITHGTQTASAIAGEGLNIGSYAPVKGVSPDVTFLPICNANYGLTYALYFAVEGYDGKTNTGDEAQIVSIGQYISGYGNGFDETSYLVEYLVNATQSHAVFISPAGNDGSGYGTIAAPCSPNTLVVGYTEDNTYISTDSEQVQHYTKISELSSRGPTAAGLAKPDVVAVGVGEVDLPLGFSGVRDTSVGGLGQTTLWEGSDLSAAIASGVMALIFEAYKGKTGSFPTTDVAMGILRSSAKDLGYDPLTQGSGFVDALAAVRAANGNSGLTLTASKTTFGNTFGIEYSSFINVLDQGENGTIPVNIHNPTTGTQSPIYQVEYLQRINVSETYPIVSNTQGYKTDISDQFPANAELIKVTAQTSYIDFLEKRGSFFMTLWDWVDSQPPGDSQHGVIDVVELSYLTGVDYSNINSLTCTLSNPQGSLRGKLVLELLPDTASGSVLPDREWRISIESFATSTWSWSSLSKTSSMITTNSNDTVNVRVDIPSDAQAGTYEAALVASYGPTPVNWVGSVQPPALEEAEYMNTTLYSTCWDDGAEGNHWNDLVNNSNAWDNDTPYGIFDDPYEFLTAGKSDRYPLVDPVEIQSAARVTCPPITIISNMDFISVSNFGDGSAGNPWVIENLDIDGSSYTQPGIAISDTTDYFIIRNCAVHDAQSSSAGITFSNVANGVVKDSDITMNDGAGINIDGGSVGILLQNLTITDNNIVQMYSGIYIGSSSEVTVDLNTITSNVNFGIYAISSSDITILGNEFHDQVTTGLGYESSVYLDSSTGCTIKGNTAYSEFWGFYLSLCDGCEMSNNTFDSFDSGSGEYGIYLEFVTTPTQPIVIADNNFTNCIAPYAYDDNPSNTNIWDGNYWEEYTDVDSEPDGVWDNPYTDIDGGIGAQDNTPMVNPVAIAQTIYTPSTPIAIASDTDFTTSPGVLNPSATGMADDPFIISGWDIDTTGFGHGIKIENTTAYFVVKDCLIHGNVAGYGVTLFNAPNGAVRCNEFSSLGTGVTIWFTSISAVRMNEMTGLTYGVYIQGSDNCTIEYNKMTGGTQGIRITSSEYCAVTMNVIGANSVNGILMDHSSDCQITFNNLASNGYGIHLENSTGFNHLHHNNLLGNTVQAYDDFVGETLASFELYSYFGIPANYYSVYNVKYCNVTVNYLPIAGYTFNADTGLVTFTTPIPGQSSGAVVSIKAVLTFEESGPDRISLPNQRLTGGTAVVKVVVMETDGTEYIVPDTSYSLYRKVGIIEFASPVNLGMGLVIFANYTYYNRTGIVPLTLNVLAAESANFNFGNLYANESALGISIIPTWGVRPGQGTSLVSGDRRYFYVRVPNQGMFSISEIENFFLYTELAWNLNMTDINIVVYGKGSTSMYLSAAPYMMKKMGGSEEKADFSFFTATMGPKDILVTNFNHEVLTICVSAKNFNGNGTPVAAFEGESGWLRLSDNNPKAWTNQDVGHTSVSFQSSLDLSSGMTASIVGPAQGTKSIEEIFQDDLTLYDLSTLEGWLTMNAVAGFTKVVTVKNALSWDVHIMGHPECSDLDLCLFLDGKAGQPKDGIAQWQEVITSQDMQFDAYKCTYGTGRYCYCADADADEAIKIISPPDGDYIIKVLGFTVSTKPGYFDMEVKSIFAGVEGYKLSHVDTEFDDEDPTSGGYLSTEPMQGYDVRTFNVLWTFPEGTEDGVYGGIFVLGVPESPQLIVIAMDITYDCEAPTLLPGFTGPDTIVSTYTPTISAKIEDLVNGEIDPYGATVMFDGIDVTDLAGISIMKTKNAAAVQGYWTGDILYKPASPLSEGNHHFEVGVKDKTGNLGTLSWSFTVDTTKPGLTLDSPEEIYTSAATCRLTGQTDADSRISIIGVPGTVNMHTDSTFDIDLALEEGVNYVAIKSTDLAGNIHEIQEIITLDTDTPVFTRVVALDGSTTNVRTTGIYGEMTEPGTLALNGILIPVNSDGTFRYDTISLTEGQNMQALEFTDRAGHVAHYYMNITLDTIAPALAVDDMDSVVHSEWLNITGTTERNAVSLTMNGKLVDISATGAFQNNIRISPGVNTIVVESKDRAGNSAAEVVTVIYSEEAGTNYAAIGLMVILLVIGLVLGLLLAPIILGREKEPEPEEPVEEILEEKAEPEAGIAAEPASELESLVLETEEAAEPAEELEPIPSEESALKTKPEEKAALESPQPSPEDPRIAKLTEAYESGKISKELYEKNLARFRQK